MERPSIRQLESLVAVADFHSFRKAATSLGISQPALSASVQAVEALLGVQVFERDRRSVLVTSAGEEVVGRARIALETVDAVAEAARRRGEPLAGALRLGVIPTIAPYWLPSLLPMVRKRYPKLELVLREDQTARLLAQLDAGQLDAALLALPVPGDFTTAAIGYEHFLVAAPRGAPLLKRHHGHLTERDLDDQTVLLLEDVRTRRRGRIDVDAGDQPADARPDGRRRTRHHAAARSRGGGARPSARPRAGRFARRLATRSHDRPRVAHIVGAAARIQAARRRDARGSRQDAREAQAGIHSQRVVTSQRRIERPSSASATLALWIESR
jgi:LysR family hydrogen peroxide-inducible transcriptional activator